MRRIAIRILPLVPVVILIAITTVVVIILARVDLHDVRIKAGHLFDPPLRPITIGGLYAVGETGHLEPSAPICVADAETQKLFFRSHEQRLELSNVFGRAIPIISQVSMAIISPIDPGLLGQGASVRQVAGHTISINPIVHVDIVQDSLLHRLVNRIYLQNPDCEREIINRYRQGDCVVVLNQVSRTSGQLIGYRYNDDCLKADLGADEALYQGLPTKPPSRSRRLAERLSDLKAYLGLISTPPMTL